MSSRTPRTSRPSQSAQTRTQRPAEMAEAEPADRLRGNPNVLVGPLEAIADSKGLPVIPEGPSFQRRPIPEDQDVRRSVRNSPPARAGSRREQLRQSAITLKRSGYAVQSL